MKFIVPCVHSYRSLLPSLRVEGEVHRFSLPSLRVEGEVSFVVVAEALSRMLVTVTFIYFLKQLKMFSTTRGLYSRGEDCHKCTFILMYSIYRLADYTLILKELVSVHHNLID